MRQLFTAALLFAFLSTGCQQEFEASRNLASDVPPQVPSPENPQSPTPPGQSCWIYDQYRVGNCNALIEFTHMGASDRENYKYAGSSDERYKAPVRLIDLTKIPLNQQITANFKLSDYLSLAKGRFGFINEHVFTLVQSVRNALRVPVRINSGYRGPAYNRKIGGATVSRHMYGDGIDLGSSQATPQQIRDACKNAGASYIQIYKDGHVHCDWRNLAGDPTFMGDEIIQPPTLAAIAAMSEEDYARMQNDIGGSAVISVESGEIHQGETIVLSAKAEEQEDPGELLTEWTVILPNGRLVENTSSALELKLKAAGHYQIMVRLGGFLEGTYEIEVY